MTGSSTCRPTCNVHAPRAHAAVHPSCKPSSPERRHQSTREAEDAEGKIEGDGTATRLQLGLHRGSRGTRGECLRAASNLHTASVLGLPRAAFAAACLAAIELRHDQA